MIWLVGIKYKSLEWPNGLARASRQSVRVAVRIPMSTRVAILGVNLLPSLRRNLFSGPHPPHGATTTHYRESTSSPRVSYAQSFVFRTSCGSDTRSCEKHASRRVAAQPKPQWQTTTAFLPSSSRMGVHDWIECTAMYTDSDVQNVIHRGRYVFCIMAVEYKPTEPHRPHAIE
jgi:hypothetical protein